jgi:hypothetical protein
VVRKMTLIWLVHRNGDAVGVWKNRYVAMFDKEDKRIGTMKFPNQKKAIKVLKLMDLGGE